METTLHEALARWQQAGLLDDEQVEALRAHEDARTDADGSPSVPEPVEAAVAAVTPPGDGGSGFIAEGLAYVGAALAFGAAVPVFGDIWEELTAAGRVGLALLGTLVVAAGSYLLREHEDGALHRLSTLLAALAAVAVSLTTALALDEFTGLEGEWVATLAGAPGFAIAAMLTRVRPSWPVTLALGGTMLTTVFGLEGAVGVLDNETAGGVTLAGIGLAWAALGWAGQLRPRNAFEITGLLAGGVGVQMLAFDAMTLGALLVGVAISLAVLAVGLTEERTPPAVLGGLGLTVFSPQLVIELFGESIGGPLALFVGGLVLVGVSVTILRQRATS